jgi:hypothetical protein
MKKRSFTIRTGPLAMSLAAAALTAVAFAAISVADNGGGGGRDRGGSGKDVEIMRAPAPPGGGAGVFFHDNLSDADRQKLEEFRQCMEDNGAPGPPDPGEIDPGDGPPKPPSAEDREKLREAFEACKDNAPEALREAGPPQLHFRGCDPGDAAPGTEERGKNENQSDGSGGSSGGSTS